jgi:hypothetical protein
MAAAFLVLPFALLVAAFRPWSLSEAGLVAGAASAYSNISALGLLRSFCDAVSQMVEIRPILLPLSDLFSREVTVTIGGDF